MSDFYDFTDLEPGMRVNVEGTWSPADGSLRASQISIKDDGEVKWTRKSEEDDDLFESGIEFLHSISQTLLSLIKRLYAERNGVIPTAVTH